VKYGWVSVAPNFTDPPLSTSLLGSKSYRFKLKDQTKAQTGPQTTHDMNDCLLESENFQITKADNNKYLLLPVKKPSAEKIVLKECGNENNMIPHFTYTHTQLPFIIDQKPNSFS
jgi:hypothetical protein